MIRGSREGPVERALASDRQVRLADGDEELARAARTDPDAFGQLYQRHRLSVYRYLRTRAVHDDEAADLTAVTFERAFGAIGRYRPSGGGFLAWLLRIARNAAIDAGRRTIPITISDPPPVRSADTPEAIAIARVEREALVAAVRRLPDVQREAIVLRYSAGLTAREIGDILGKSEGATQKLISRALTAIREHDDVER
jgi:RNA polymerase sigma-70 factor (ECF subfamily)